MTSHRETAYKEQCKGLSLPKSEDLSDRSIIIPLYIPMADEDVSRVIANLRELLKA
jgi:dTDP-4-amino-4,6-dideoxygalactose transaminase